jgi:hypothetical protein
VGFIRGSGWVIRVDAAQRLASGFVRIRNKNQWLRFGSPGQASANDFVIFLN